MTYRDEQQERKSFTEGDRISNLIYSIKRTASLLEGEWSVRDGRTESDLCLREKRRSGFFSFEMKE